MTMSTIVKVTRHKSGLLKHTESLLKRPAGSMYIINIIYNHIYLPALSPRGLEVDLEGSSTFPILMLSIHSNRLGLFHQM